MGKAGSLPGLFGSPVASAVVSISCRHIL